MPDSIIDNEYNQLRKVIGQAFLTKRIQDQYSMQMAILTLDRFSRIQDKEKRLLAYSKLYSAIGEYSEAERLNKPANQVRDTFLKSVTDMLVYASDVGKGVKDTVQALTKPALLIPIIIVILFVIFGLPILMSSLRTK